jgi:hypothetical protein
MATIRCQYGLLEQRLIVWLLIDFQLSRQKLLRRRCCLFASGDQSQVSPIESSTKPLKRSAQLSDLSSENVRRWVGAHEISRTMSFNEFGGSMSPDPPTTVSPIAMLMRIS